MQAHATVGPELRPLSIGEILDVAIKIYFRHALTLFRIVLLVVAPVQILVALIQTSSALDDEATNVSGTEIAVLATGMLVVVVLTVVASTIATGACFKAVADAYLEEHPTWRSSLAFAFRRFHSILWVTILAGLATVAGAIACLIPGIYLWVLFSVAVPVLLTEGVRGSSALGRSRRLVQGRWWPTFGVVIVGYLLATLVSFFVGAAAGASLAAGVDEASVAAFLVNAIGGTLGSVLSTPFTAAFTTVLYFDLRVRKEGFDLQLLAERIGLAPRPEGYRVAPAPGLPPTLPPGGEAPPYWPPPPGWQPSGGFPAGPPGVPGPPPPGSAEAPPYWPPPPGWGTGGASTAGPPGPGAPPPGSEDAPPFWPPPPGWRPPSQRDDA